MRPIGLTPPWLPILALLTVVWTACATQSSGPKTIIDLNQAVGSWKGWIGCRECSERFRASLAVRDDGRWDMFTERNPSYHD
jgi:hypothetical protein